MFSIFQSDLPSIYAAWEGLLSIVIDILSFIDLDQEITQMWRTIDIHSVTCSLIEVALHRTKWLTENDEDLVLAAILISNSNLVQQLLGKGACPENTEKRSEAICRASRAGSAPCIKILIEGCDPNYWIEGSGSQFAFILERTVNLSGRKRTSERENKQRELLLQVVDSYLEAGADVDSPYPPCKKHQELLEQTQVPKDWYPTYLDWLFQCERGLFDRVQPRNSVSETTITRHGIILAAMQGESALSVYLRSRTSQTAAEVSRFLELVLREQFISSTLWDFFNIKINGLVVTCEIFRAAVSDKGTYMLDVLRKFVVDIGMIGGPALVKAARLGNYEAVDWLLGFGVDIKSPIPDEIGSRDGFKANTVIGIFILRGGKQSSDISMLRYLVGCGAELKRTVSDQHAGGLTQLIKWHGEPHATKLIPWILDQLEERGTRKMSRAELQDLYAFAAIPGTPLGFEKSIWRSVFDRLRNTYGLPPCLEAILGPMIVAGAHDEVIQELIRASIDINTYPDERSYICYSPIQAAASVGNYPLVVQLFKIGADVNGPPQGRFGKTALQAICAWNPLSEKDKSCQQNIVNFLIKKGANINAGPAHGGCGVTAIMAAVEHGNIELATVLLAHGADPNIYPWQLTKLPCATLDLAHGSCDMTKLLLNAGALSSHRGSTGYEGALWRAEYCGNNAVADIIRDHMLQKEGQFRSNPELRDLHDAVVCKLDLEDASRHANETYDEEDMKDMEKIQILAGEQGWNYPPQPRP
ncbi:unnamed protein product [Clonostachys rhizophaga]|uniref:Uncharacterized protein n=1 Tax=Clonostachys rhizophaga TaxID=160324 RepID=A0A9N9VAG0_9HYPO|nr:unnamed protein product [Clonostachys rhizophaga]